MAGGFFSTVRVKLTQYVQILARDVCQPKVNDVH